MAEIVLGRVSVIIPGRCEPYFQQTIDSALERATGDVEIVAIVDGPGQEPMVYSDDPRVKIVELDESIGQRAGYNLGVRESSGQYVMKIDAHALLSPGFDEALKAHCPPMAVMMPEMRRLDVHKWKDKPRGKTRFMFFGMDMYCHSWTGYRKRPEAQVDYPETMNGNGSCWFCTREWNDWIGLLDEGVGSWGNVGIEVGLRTWLCGGSFVVNKQAWQAHWFRKDEGGFTYPMDGRKVGRAHKYTRENYYFKDDAFEHQIRPFHWLIEKFQPPGWEAYLVDHFESPRVIVYYTDSQLEPRLANAVRKQIDKVRGLIPVISVSQKPLRWGKNINAGPKPRLYRSMYEQLLAGLEAAPEDSIVYLCEHDVFYHPSHFAFLPPDDDQEHAYFNTNRYYYALGAITFLRPRSKFALSHAVGHRGVFIKHCRERLALWDKGIEVTMSIPHEWFSSDRPNVDMRHGNNLTPDGDYKKEWKMGRRGGIRNLPGWGSPPHFERKVGYKEFMRWDVVKTVVQRYGCQSYLEIGVKRGETFNKVACPLKHGVDPKGGTATHPVTSDQFFADLPSGQLYDVIFIDGLHESEQVKRDIANALEHLAPNGTIVMHDCSPRNEQEQTVPQPVGQGIWTGDVWKAFVHYQRRPDLEMYVVDTNNGVGVIRRGQQEPLVVDAPTWDQFKRNRPEWLNLKSVEDFRSGV